MTDREQTNALRLVAGLPALPASKKRYVKGRRFEIQQEYRELRERQPRAIEAARHVDKCPADPRNFASWAARRRAMCPQIWGF